MSYAQLLAQSNAKPQVKKASRPKPQRKAAYGIIMSDDKATELLDKLVEAGQKAGYRLEPAGTQSDTHQGVKLFNALESCVFDFWPSRGRVGFTDVNLLARMGFDIEGYGIVWDTTVQPEAAA